MSHDLEKFKYRAVPLSRSEETLRARRMSGAVRGILNILPGGVTVEAADISHRLPIGFLEDNYTSAHGVLASVNATLRSLSKTGKDLVFEDDGYKVPKGKRTSPRIHKMRATCMHVKSALARGDSFEDIVRSAPVEVTAHHVNPETLIRSLRSVINRIATMPEDDFEAFAQDLLTGEKTRSPFSRTKA